MTGVAERIISELRRSGSNPRGWFEPAVRGGWLYTADYTFVSSAERAYILKVLGGDE